MLLTLKVFILSILCTDIIFSEDKVENSTVISRREVMEQQARTAYQNACYRLQELSNWMTAVFRIKSVWASATVNEMSSHYEGSLTEADRKKMAGLPRSKIAGSECSLSSVQVTAQTYAYLQSQLVMMKWLLGRSIFKSGRERLEEARERMKMLEAFNTTLNGVVSKLKTNTANTSVPADSETLKARSLTNTAEGSFLHILQSPKRIVMNILDDQVMNNRALGPGEPRSFFQNLGKNLDRIIFPASRINIASDTERSIISEENSANKTEHPVTSVEDAEPKTEHSVTEPERSPFSNQNFVPKAEYSAPEPEHSPFSNKNFVPKSEYSAPKVSTSSAIMFSSIL